MSAVDVAKVLLGELRLPAMKAIWQSIAERADKEAWPAARLLGALAEQEVADRTRRRFERHLSEAKLPPGKTLANFEFDAVPMVSRAHVNALVKGDRWLDQGANLILIGPSGGGKSHLAAAIGLALVENGFRVLYARTTDLVQRLQVARREHTSPPWRTTTSSTPDQKPFSGLASRCGSPAWAWWIAKPMRSCTASGNRFGSALLEPTH